MAIGGREISDEEQKAAMKRINDYALNSSDPCPHCGSLNSKIWPSAAHQAVGWSDAEGREEFIEIYSILCFNCGLLRMFSTVLLNEFEENSNANEVPE